MVSPTIGSNCSSIPEVIGLEDALFDPLSPVSIKNKIEEVLTSNELRKTLTQSGLERAKVFKWEITAQKALQAIQDFVITHAKSNLPLKFSDKRQKTCICVTIATRKKLGLPIIV